MNLLLTILGLALISSTTFADTQCDLDGGAQFTLACENNDLGIKIELSGDSGSSLQATKVDSPNAHYTPDLEHDLPLVSFERLEEGVFAAKITSSRGNKTVNPNLTLTAIPTSVKLDPLRKLTQPHGALEGSGTFTGRLDGLFNLNIRDYESTRVNTTVKCTFNFLRGNCL